ncbi:MAG: FHA domain-containing protein [Actinomycetota bacterium]|nr:FHA domain-containing protein [Actinomycetota bacterium]
MASTSRVAVVEILRGGDVFQMPLEGPTLSIGRAPDNDVILDDPAVSRHHARIERSGEVTSIVDLGSANATRINDAEVEPKVVYHLREGDTVRIGGYALRLRAETGPVVAGSRGGAIPAGLHTEMAAPVASAAVGAAGVAAAGVGAPPRLVVATPRGTREFPLNRDVMVLGRDPTADIPVDEQVVSRRHAELRRAGAGWEIVDLGSMNGLAVNGQRFQQKVLLNGEQIRIASSVTLTYLATASTPPPAAPAVAGPGPAAASPHVEHLDRGIPQRISLAGKATLTFGRDPRNDVAMDHPSVSRLHARLVRYAEGFAIEDHGSTNGTFVNGSRLVPGQPAALRVGDVIRIGPAKFIYAPEVLERIEESRNLSLDVLHLNQVVAKGLNLLQDISFSIKPREFVAVVGVSGAGKSTLLDALNGFRPANQGHVLVNGTDLYRNLDSYRTDLGYVPQDDIIHKELSPYQALDFAAQLRLPADTTDQEREARVLEVLQILGLSERKDVPITRLSGGQRKRVSIGVELLTRPGLFFLDEATSGLDPGTESQMMKLLRTLADQGHTIVLITHATKNVMLCDQVVFLAKGGFLSYYGPPEEALGFFGVQDFDEIYIKLEQERSPAEWAEQYRHSPQFRTFVVERLQGVAAGDSGPVQRVGLTPGSTVKHVSGFGQLAILSRRSLAILGRDRFSLLLMLAIAPGIGLMDLLTWKKQFFSDPRQAGQARTFMFLALLTSVLIGAIASMREIVKESEVYRRERMVTLKIAPYVLSKVWLGVVLALYQAAVFTATKKLATGFFWPPGAGGIAKAFVTFFLATMSGMLLGLFISAISSNQNVTPLLLIVFLVPQFMFGNPDLSIGKAGDAIGNITTTKWGFQALLIISGKRFSSASLWPKWGILLLICGVLFVLLLAAQKRKDIKR